MDDTVAVYNIMPHIECTNSVLNETPPLFYPFGSEVEYTQVL